MTHSTSKLRSGTLCIHAGTHLDPQSGGVCTPVYASTAHVHPHPSGENVYPRYFNTLNQRVVAEKMAALEGAEAGLVFASGMAAISTVLLAHLQAGDHLLCQADLYGGTLQLLSQELPRLGMEVSYARTEEEFAALLRPNTRILYVESPSNPLLRCLDLASLARLGRAQGALTVVDNTFATPINQHPLELGFDVVVHSGTKFLNGHSDLNCGVAVGARTHMTRIRECALSCGGMLDAHACSQLERGLKTLALRVRQQNENAARLARFLAEHPVVDRVHYPGLPSHPTHAIAARQMSGFGGMLSFELKRPDRVPEFLRVLRLFTPALSLGGVESLVCVPSQTSHVNLTPQERSAAGISDGLLRVSVGIEDADDLVEDFEQALSRV